MALTAYQTQYKRRMKRGIQLRAAADRKARAYARLLATALAEAATAKAVMDQLNKLYDVDVSTQTLLVHSLTEKVGADMLTELLGESQPGEEAVLFNQIPDGNGGQALPTDAVFGEKVAAGSPKAPTGPLKPKTPDLIPAAALLEVSAAEVHTA